MRKPGWGDDIFFRELKVGLEHEGIVADALRAHKIKCKTDLEARYDLDFDERMAKYAGSPDIVLSNGDVIEVKSRNIAFEDDPDSFPYPTVIVETVSSWKAHEPIPIAVVHISQITGEMLVTMAYDEPHWTIEKKYDRVRKIYDTWYMADRNHLETFDFLVGYIKSNATKKK